MFGQLRMWHYKLPAGRYMRGSNFLDACPCYLVAPGYQAGPYAQGGADMPEKRRNDEEEFGHEKYFNVRICRCSDVQMVEYNVLRAFICISAYLHIYTSIHICSNNPATHTVTPALSKELRNCRAAAAYRPL